MAKFDKITLFTNDINLNITGNNFFDIEARAFCQLSSIYQHFSEKRFVTESYKD